ncbi:MAG TPA: glycosyltransferase [Methyloprofundus sp.]|uniref:glycosyltransferase family 2 protein n=1 Tax=Methyloprofundus sp. TaxID=2020875 RepID=UPI001836285F|nr:glycosyltransferase family 2 protein [Methyloprofundus sp.]HIG65569.1 glycosyltransferase [Methyloprofundus sp.]HIL78466.1 glycosyltransferase [Methylococcales bacterium]
MKPTELLSIIIPFHNEQEVISECQRRISAAVAAIDMQIEILYVNDGSKDDSLDILIALMQQDKRIKIIDLSRNFGKETAMTAGLDVAKGDAVVIIDADLQDPPELITEMVKIWRTGFDVVYAKRTKRKGESLVKKATARLFYKLINKISDHEIPENVGDFRLMSRQAVDALNQVRERKRFMKGLFAWIGFPQTAIEYSRDPRLAGKTNWNYRKLTKFAIEGISSFTQEPLRLATYMGFLTAFGAFALGLFYIIKTLMFGDAIQGFPTLITVILFFSGVQLLSIGILGEYIGHMFIESKQRPLYFIKKTYSAKADD